MATENQIKANRENARHSTGPRTPEDKAHLAANHTTHALTGRHAILRTGMPRAEFDEQLHHLIDMVKTRRPAKGFDEVMVAGEPEWRNEERRRREGIPLDEALWHSMQEWAERLGIR